LLLVSDERGVTLDDLGEMEQKIIDFSELGEFIDRPVKTYSSGMYVRLAFSIATMVDPDILVIDEALAVGDMAFQKKCMGRMKTFRKQGKTMAFCSHSMYHIQELCDTVIWLDKGQIREIGDTHSVVSHYEEFCNGKNGVIQPSATTGAEQESTPQTPRTAVENNRKDTRIISVSLKSPEGEELESIAPFTDAVMEMEVEIIADNATHNFGFAFMSMDDTCFAANMTHHDQITCGPYYTGEHVTIRFNARHLPMRTGSYRLLGAVADDSGLLWYNSMYTSPISINADKGMGVISLAGDWEIKSV